MPQPAPEHLTQDAGAIGAEHHLHADLARLLRDALADDAVQTGDDEQHRGAGEDAERDEQELRSLDVTPRPAIPSVRSFQTG